MLDLIAVTLKLIFIKNLKLLFIKFRLNFINASGNEEDGLKSLYLSWWDKSINALNYKNT